MECGNPFGYRSVSPWQLEHFVIGILFRFQAREFREYRNPGQKRCRFLSYPGRGLEAREKKPSVEKKWKKVLFLLGQKTAARQKSGIEFSGDEIRACYDLLMQRYGSVNSLDDEHAEGPAHAGDGLGSVAAVSDQLGDQRVIIRWDNTVLICRGIDANARSAGQVKPGDAPRRRRKCFRVFGIDPALDRVAAQFHRTTQDVREFFAGGDSNLRLH